MSPERSVSHTGHDSPFVEAGSSASWPPRWPRLLKADPVLSTGPSGGGRAGGRRGWGSSGGRQWAWQPAG